MTLPAAARKALDVALAQKELRGPRAWKALDRAFAAVGWVDPENDILPLAKDLPPVQRELIAKIADPALADGLDIALPGR